MAYIQPGPTSPKRYQSLASPRLPRLLAFAPQRFLPPFRQQVNQLATSLLRPRLLLSPDSASLLSSIPVEAASAKSFSGRALLTIHNPDQNVLWFFRNVISLIEFGSCFRIILIYGILACLSHAMRWENSWYQCNTIDTRSKPAQVLSALPRDIE